MEDPILEMENQETDKKNSLSMSLNRNSENNSDAEF